MTIYYDVSAAVHARSGLGRYAESLGRALLANHREQMALFYNQDPTIQPLIGLDAIPRRTINAGYKRWRMQVWIGQLLRQHFNHLLPGATLYHATEHLLMSLPGVPTVLTVHDLIFRLFPRYHKPLNYLFLNLTVPLFCRRADTIIAVSDCTKRDIVHTYHIDPAKIVVVHEAAPPRFAPPSQAAIDAARAQYHLPERYLLTVCVIEPKKNHLGFLQAFEQLVLDDPDLYWVIVGGRGWLYENFFAALETSPARDRVIMPGYITDDALPAVLGGAQAFVFPSLYEGFGLPPLEAMACGTPVISSNTSSLPEVCGDAAQYFDPHHPEEMVAAARSVLADASLREAMSGHGLEQASQFSWQRAADETWEIYQRLRNRSG
ncbi:MAG: glycosyltransferase family 4 protein [Anaerolineae bacterium]|nr:glycosyltransferase family 4 protein [Anaerolineae bacterium]